MVILIHTHQECTDKIDLLSISKDFVTSNERCAGIINIYMSLLAYLFNITVILQVFQTKTILRCTPCSSNISAVTILMTLVPIIFSIPMIVWHYVKL